MTYESFLVLHSKLHRGGIVHAKKLSRGARDEAFV